MVDDSVKFVKMKQLLTQIQHKYGTPSHYSLSSENYSGITDPHSRSVIPSSDSPGIGNVTLPSETTFSLVPRLTVSVSEDLYKLTTSRFLPDNMFPVPELPFVDFETLYPDPIVFYNWNIGRSFGRPESLYRW